MARSVGATNSSNESWALTGLPGKPITGMPRYGAGRLRPAGLHRHAADPAAERLERLAHHLVVAHRDAAARDHELGVGGVRGVELVAQPRRPRRAPAPRAPRRRRPPDRRGERDAVRVGDLARARASAPGGTSSLPVLTTATRTRSRTSSSVSPDAAAAARWRDASRSPGGSTSAPAGEVGAGLAHVLARRARPRGCGRSPSPRRRARCPRRAPRRRRPRASARPS